MPVEIINYNGKEIIYADHRGLTGDEIIENMKSGSKIILSKGQGVLSLSDFRDASISNAVMDYIKSEEMQNVTKNISKEAIIGIKGIKKVAVNFYNKFTGTGSKVFDTLEDAKEYLTK